jgi:hypothetical protein
MRTLSVTLSLLVLALAALSFVPLPDLGPVAEFLPAAIGVAALALTIAVLLDRPKAPTVVEVLTAPPLPVAVAVPPAPAPAPVNTDAEVVNLLALFQDKGRLVDFLMDDVTPYSDAQIGAAARVLHAGCKAVLVEHFGVRALRDEAEGARITVPAGYGAESYRLVGRISGEAPFSGTLIHHGWVAEWVKLPRLLHSGTGKHPTIAPAEVELG